MKIADNGVGFNVENVKGGIGFANMNRRVMLFSGNLTVDSTVGNGCKILVKIPLLSTK
jgi:signal transduction histidine kinase